jgi:putative ABC transport system permease protein
MERKILSFVLAQTDHAIGPDGRLTKISPEEVADRIQRQTGLGARTSEKFTYKTIKYYLLYTGIPINFGITVFLGFLVGTAVAGQTFYNFTIENLKQFGALKAMGATNLRIVRMILLQAAVAGVLGYGIGVGLSTVFGWKTLGWRGQPSELAFFTPWQLLPATAVAIVLICVLASLLSVQRVIRLEPAIVFRG